MQVNSFNQNNLYGQNPSFKSIIPTKIMLDGQEVTDKKIVDKVYKTLHKSLFKAESEQEKSIKKAFLYNDKDFERSYYQVAPVSTNDRCNMIRHGLVRDGNGIDRTFTFTSGCARALTEIAKRARGETNLSNPAVKKEKGADYYKKMKEFIVNRMMYPRLVNSQGDRLLFVINAESEQAAKKTKLKISGIKFIPFKPQVHQLVTPINNGIEKVVQTDFFSQLA